MGSRSWIASAAVGLLLAGASTVFLSTGDSLQQPTMSVEGQLGFSDGLHRVHVKDMSATSEKLTLRSGEGIAMRQFDDVKRWLSDVKAVEEEDQLEAGHELPDDQEHEMAAILARHIQAMDPERAGKCPRWTLASVIYRKGKGKSYTNDVHRDLSEVSTANLREHEGQVYFYNAWVPRRDVHSSPLALALPSTVDIANDASGFLGMEHDTTGLTYRDSHQWLYWSGMRLGDVIFWRSDLVYHASFQLPGEESLPPRVSMDMRIYFHDS